MKYLLILILLLPSVLSAQVEKVTLADTLTEHDALESVHIVLTNNTQDHFSLNLPRGAKDVTSDLAHTFENDVLNFSLECESCLIEFSYTLPNVVTEQGDVHKFTRTVSIPVTPLMFEYDVKLPQGAVVQKSDTPAIVPLPSGIDTDGSHIIVKWSDHSPKLPAIYEITFASAEAQEKNIGEFFSEFEEWQAWTLMIFFGVLGFILGVLFSSPKKSYAAQISSIPLHLLSPDEKVVVQVLQKKKDAVMQKDLVKELGWSKSKVSAVLSNLEYKKVIDREKYGRNARVSLRFINFNERLDK
ncbi:hypothetical protein D6774_02890 [Candidatus Woesearchaeota archaeon]|nr:MAG: hypothetical protein D6774_02890 [Candidatus Woesearchaeota archaeon]